MLFSITANRRRTLLILALASFSILSYGLHKRLFKINIFGNHHENPMKQPEGFQNASAQITRDGICQAGNKVRCKERRKEQAIKEILARLDQRMPKVTFTDIKTTTSAKNSKATILNPRSSYCVGDPLMVQLDLYNYLGKRKEYGGDFLRARIYSSSLAAGASGHIEDYKNGTYLVNFTLFWEGNVRVSILLIHPSEGVSALWAARKKGYDKIHFTGTFLNGTSGTLTKCGFAINTQAELCEYLDERDQEAFYCVKPNNVPCAAFVSLRSNNAPISYLTTLEQRLFRRNNIGVEIPQSFGELDVLPCNRTAAAARERCRIGMGSPVPSGYALRDVWYPQFCSRSNFSKLDQIQACLRRKAIYLMGDSTLRQWIYYLTDKVATLKFFDCHSAGLFKTRLALDLERNSFVQWKRHGVPFLSRTTFSMKEDKSIASEIDRLPGGQDTAVAITLGQHFRPFPVQLFVRRLLNIRRAIRQLLLRSPSTSIVIRTENTREMSVDPERLGDGNGYPQTLAVRDIFQGLRVGFIDAWDMNIAYAINDLHPPNHVVWNQIVMFLTYIC